MYAIRSYYARNLDAMLLCGLNDGQSILYFIRFSVDRNMLHVCHLPPVAMQAAHRLGHRPELMISQHDFVKRGLALIDVELFDFKPSYNFV